jgi:hypothetical protein
MRERGKKRERDNISVIIGLFEGTREEKEEENDRVNNNKIHFICLGSCITKHTKSY